MPKLGEEVLCFRSATTCNVCPPLCIILQLTATNPGRTGEVMSRRSTTILSPSLTSVAGPAGGSA